MKIISFIVSVEKGLKPDHSKLFSDLILNLLPRLTKEGYVSSIVDSLSPNDLTVSKLVQQV